MYPDAINYGVVGKEGKAYRRYKFVKTLLQDKNLFVRVCATSIFTVSTKKRVVVRD